MSDALKNLLENESVSKAVRSEIEQAWNHKIEENRQRVTTELREEFAQKYEHDKTLIAEAVDAMVSEKLAEEITEFKQDREKLAEARVKYIKAMKDNSRLMEKFVISQLNREIKELKEDRKAQKIHLKQIEKFVAEQLAREIGEFQTDKRDLAETKVRLVKEAKAQLTQLKENFVKTSARTVSTTVSRALKSEITQLKEDISQARQNDFGRKLFEAFSSEYVNSYLNEKGELVKLNRMVEHQQVKLAEAKNVIKKANALIESERKRNQQLITESTRTSQINDLIQPLNTEQKSIMKDLLESVNTDRLQQAFDRYLPTVIGGDAKPATRKPLTEGRSVTGDRQVKKPADNSNVTELRRLAGL